MSNIVATQVIRTLIPNFVKFEYRTCANGRDGFLVIVDDAHPMRGRRWRFTPDGAITDLGRRPAWRA